MNIFDVIGMNVKLQEPHVTSVLGWFLDPKQSHGCSGLFLNHLLMLLDEKGLGSPQSAPRLKKRQMFDSKKYAIDIIIEFPVKNNADDKRNIDIVICLEGGGEKHYIAIENKILDGSVKEEQLIEQVDGMIKVCGDKDKLSYIYLTPSISGKSQAAFDKVKNHQRLEFTRHLSWDTVKEEVFIKCLQDENAGLASPMSYETKFILKSFIQFISNDFKLPALPKVTSLQWDETMPNLNDLYNFWKAEERDFFFVGFDGGAKKLNGRSLDYLVNRSYKVTLSECSSTQWLDADTFFELVKSKGWSPLV